VANRVTGGLKFIRDRFRPLSTTSAGVLVPDDRELRYVFARFDHAESDFMKLDFVNKDLRYEDFNVGRQYSLESAFSSTLIGAHHNTAFGRASLSDGHRISDTSFTAGSIAVESRFAGGAEHTVASGTIMGVWRRRTRHPSTTVARLAVHSGWRLDRDAQFFADGLNGLRGYRAFAFSGSRSVIVNLEQRIYLGRELLQIVSPGVVAFVDAGNATNGGMSDLLRLKADAGIGIRIGLPRTPKNLLRMDVAYAFAPDWRGRKGWLISFGSGQAF
ncbi:MAG TPA: BamA/TamA family outer membrane protein, partial [Thermoanaerobaculia bacterium]|nr:BamA/TamA family outer membrane protein [Thermoanaerobaculia bacterium]